MARQKETLKDRDRYATQFAVMKVAEMLRDAELGTAGVVKLRVEDYGAGAFDDVVEFRRRGDVLEDRIGWQIKKHTGPLRGEVVEKLLSDLASHPDLSRGMLGIARFVPVKGGGTLPTLKELCRRAGQPGVNLEALARNLSNDERTWVARVPAAAGETIPDKLALLARFGVQELGDEDALRQCADDHLARVFEIVPPGLRDSIESWIQTVSGATDITAWLLESEVVQRYRKEWPGVITSTGRRSARRGYLDAMHSRVDGSGGDATFDDRAAAERALSTARVRPDASGAVDEAWLMERVALQRRTERIHIAGCNTYIARKEALRLYLSPRAERGLSAVRSFEACYLFEAGKHWNLIIGSPGAGKSSILLAIAAQLASENRVLHGSLSEVDRRMSRGESFLSSLAGTTTDGRHDETRFAHLVGGADALLLDGLDETTMHRAAIVDELARWPQRFPDMRMAVTAREGDETSSLLTGFQPFTLAPPRVHDIGDFVERVAIAMGRPGDAATARRRVNAAIGARPELGTPLLLGFLAALAIAGDDELTATPARLYERVLTLMARSGRIDRRYKVSLDPRNAAAVLDELAWARHVDRHADDRELIVRVVAGLADRGTGGGDLYALAQQGLDFWEERGIVRRVLRPQRDDLELVHATFQDFAAGRRLSQSDRAEIARFAAAASSAEEMAILSVAASLGASAAIVEAMLALEPSDPERILACARAVVHGALPEPVRARLADALIALIEYASIPTHAADAGAALAHLVDAERVDIARTYEAIGDHSARTDEARRLAALRVRVACVGKGAAGTVSTWISDQLAYGAPSGGDFKRRSFSAWKYLNDFMVEAVRVAALREGEPIAAELVRRIREAGRMSPHIRTEVAGWAHAQARLVLRDAALAVAPEWASDMDWFREDWKRSLDGDLGLLDTLDLACEDVAGMPGDGSALALLLASSEFREVADVDVGATFSIPELRPLLAPVLKAWCTALDIDRRRLRRDIAEARRRGEAAIEAGIGSPFLGLPATPSRPPVWSRVNFADPELSPERLIVWLELRFRTPVILTMPILLEQRPALVEAILAKLGKPTRNFLVWLSEIGQLVDDSRVTQAVEAILAGEWPPGAHHLLELLDGDALKRPEIRTRLLAAFTSENVVTVEAVAAAVLRMEPIDPAAVEAARVAFARWTERPRKKTGKTIGRNQIQLVTQEPTPRAMLAPLVILGPDGRASELLGDDDHGVRDLALARVRGAASCAADLELIAQSASAPDLIRTMIHRIPLRDHEVEWMCSTAHREEIPEAARLALIDAFADAAPEAIPDQTAESTLRALCEDGSVAIRDRALNALRRRATRS